MGVLCSVLPSEQAGEIRIILSRKVFERRQHFMFTHLPNSVSIFAVCYKPNTVLKIFSRRFSLVVSVRCIPNQCPTVVCQHCWSPFALISLFHGSNVLVKAFAMFIADITKIVWKEVQVRVQKVNFQRHITLHVLICLQHLLNQFSIILCFIVA